MNESGTGWLRALRPLCLATLFGVSLSACAPFPEYHAPANGAELRGQVVENALSVLGEPYRFGGDAPGGFDCSGLIHYAYRQVGMNVPRTAAEQYRYADWLHLDRLEPGDLVFFRLQGTVSHVGMYIGDGRMVHAPSTGSNVRIDRVRDRFWRARYAGGARLLPVGSSNDGSVSQFLAW